MAGNACLFLGRTPVPSDRWSCGRVDDRQSPFGHHFFQISIAERIAQVPANAQQDDFGLVMPPFEWVFHEGAFLVSKQSGEGYPTSEFFATEPICAYLLCQRLILQSRFCQLEDVITYLTTTTNFWSPLSRQRKTKGKWRVNEGPVIKDTISVAMTTSGSFQPRAAASGRKRRRKRSSAVTCTSPLAGDKTKA